MTSQLCSKCLAYNFLKSKQVKPGFTAAWLAKRIFLENHIFNNFLEICKKIKDQSTNLYASLWFI